MAKIVVYYNDKETGSLNLATGKSYTVGRAPENDLVLNVESLSRHHFKLVWENGWSVHLTSKNGEILYQGSPQSQFTLKNGDTFSIQPFLFKFSETLGTTKTTFTNSDPTQPLPSAFDRTNNTDDKTFVAQQASLDWSLGIPYITITYPDKQKEKLRMEGEFWTIGRDQQCEIVIEDPKASRKHAEIEHQNGAYLLKDLNSSNGVVFNGKKLQPGVPVSLISGDRFLIGKTEFYFEIRDPHYNEKVKNLPVELTSTLPHESSTYTESGPGAIRMDQFSLQNRKPFLIGGAAIVLILALVMGSDDKSKEGKRELGSKSKNEKEKEKLTSQQKELLEKSYKLAKTLYMSQKYEMALTEIQKVHELTNSYEDSREIEQLSREAIQTKMQQRELELQEQQQDQIKVQIKSIVDQCETEFMSNTSAPDAVRSCLNQALELDPGNEEAQNLISKAEEFQRNKEIQQQSKRDYENKVVAGKNLYSTAQRLLNEGKTKEAYDTFQRHISSNYPDPDNLRVKSRSALAQLKQELKSKTESYRIEAEQLKNQDKIKDAIVKLRKALEIEPNNPNLRDLQDEYNRELRKNMKALYSDSVLEENLGNIDAAKDKWKKIKDLDLPNGEYYQKARSKMKKYGLE